MCRFCPIWTPPSKLIFSIVTGKIHILSESKTGGHIDLCKAPDFLEGFWLQFEFLSRLNSSIFNIAGNNLVPNLGTEMFLIEIPSPRWICTKCLYLIPLILGRSMRSVQYRQILKVGFGKGASTISHWCRGPQFLCPYSFLPLQLGLTSLYFCSRRPNDPHLGAQILGVDFNGTPEIPWLVH
jgi:hypothetical protein